MIKLLVISQGKQGGVPFYRVNTPHTYLQNNFSDRIRVDFIELNEFQTLEQLDGYDILFFHRHLENQHLKNDIIIKYCNDKNIKVVVDLDDSYEVPNNHPAYGIYKTKKLKEKILNNFQKADLVTTTTPYFKGQIRKFRQGKPVRILPNAIDPTWDMFQPKEKVHTRATVGWIGGSSHKDDIKLLRNLSSKITSKEKGTVLFGGFDTRGKRTKLHPLIQKQIDAKQPVNLQSLGLQQHEVYQQVDMLPDETVSVFYEKLFTNNYNLVSDEYKDFLLKYEWQKKYENENDERYKRVWTKDINKYAEIYNEIDISVAPLTNTHFNRCKSNLKVIEAGFHKTPIICQRLAPYIVDIEHGVNGFLVDEKRNHKDWTKYCKLLIDSEDLRKEMGENLFKTVSEKYNLDKISKKRLRVYEKLVSGELV